MIKSIELEYFFSFGKTQTIILNPDTNILIGINGSGKSNFIKIIQLLYEGVVGKDGLETLINKKWSGFSGLVNNSEENIETVKISYEFDKNVVKSVLNGKGHHFSENPIYEIKIHKLGTTNYYFSENIYTKSTQADNISPFTYLNVSHGRGIISTRQEQKIKLKQATFKENELVLRQISEPDRFFPLFTLQKAIEQIAVYNAFDTSPNSTIRQLSPYYSEQKLLPNGENLTYLLNYLNTHHTFQYDKINELLNKINRNFKSLAFQTIGSKTLLALKEKNLHRAINAEHISDGTLRFLLLLSIFYNPNRGKIICIDEPETGLHPDMIQTVCEGIRYASQNGTQMIVATHSPLLLNAFDLEDLKIFEKDDKNSTFVSNKTEENFPEWEGEFLVGQMWLRGQIGGVRW